MTAAWKQWTTLEHEVWNDEDKKKPLWQVETLPAARLLAATGYIWSNQMVIYSPELPAAGSNTLAGLIPDREHHAEDLLRFFLPSRRIKSYQGKGYLGMEMPTQPAERLMATGFEDTGYETSDSAVYGVTEGFLAAFQQALEEVHGRRAATDQLIAEEAAEAAQEKAREAAELAAEEADDDDDDAPPDEAPVH